jgi:hypothetical protein
MEDRNAYLYNELDRCKKWIEDALEYGGGTHDFNDVVEGVLSGHMQLWAGEKACAITEIIVFPKKKVLHVFLAGGAMAEIVAMNKSAKIWGEAQGCSAMTIAGRKGWERVLKEHGYKPVFTTLSLEI